MSTIDLAVLEKYTNEQLYNYLRSVSNEEKKRNMERSFQRIKINDN